MAGTVIEWYEFLLYSAASALVFGKLPFPATETGALKAGVSPKIISERIGHADVGSFLQTYAHVLTNDDREAAEQAASFLIGEGREAESDDEQP
jgi:hypothetical protein